MDTVYRFYKSLCLMSAARFREMFSLLQAVTQDCITVHIWAAASMTCLKLVTRRWVTRLPSVSLGCFCSFVWDFSSSQQRPGSSGVICSSFSSVFVYWSSQLFHYWWFWWIWDWHVLINLNMWQKCVYDNRRSCDGFIRPVQLLVNINV